MRRPDLLRRLYRYWLSPVFDPIRAVGAIREYVAYARDWRRYVSMPDAEPLAVTEAQPCLFDRRRMTPFDPHYVYQALWATDRIVQSRVQNHVDVGSDVDFVTMLTVHLPVSFVDIRPLLAAGIDRLNSLGGNVLALPFAAGSVRSLSCLHVAEHIGLGRYGDALDPRGTRKACAELARVLAPGGSLYFSVPVGRPRVCFNAHRIHRPDQILEFFRDLRLVQFSAVDDAGRLARNVSAASVTEAEYACGLFWFRRDGSSGGEEKGG